MKTIIKYKGVNLKYCEEDGMIYFNFEGRERKTKYIFEAKSIIDEPIWENCNLEGYFIDGYLNKYIGLAKATRRDIKSGKPDWKFMGEYDREYKDNIKVYLRNKSNDEIYLQWQEQRKVYQKELEKLNNLAMSLTKK